MASGTSTQVGKSSLPVLTKVPSAVRIRKNMEAWKKRSAGSARGFAREVGDSQRRRRSDVRERNCLRTRHARKLRNGYAKGLQRDGVVRDGVARGGQQL